MENQNKQQIINLQVTDGLAVAVIQDQTHEFLMPTKDVALGYGVASNTISSAKTYHKDELLENTHFLVLGNSDSGNGNLKKLYWTKAGIVRLGFFIKSERAKLFREWAQGVILQVLSPEMPKLPAPVKRKHNRLDAARLLRVMSLVALVPNAELRNALVKELMPDDLGIGVQLSLLTPAL